MIYFFFDYRAFLSLSRLISNKYPLIDGDLFIENVILCLFVTTLSPFRQFITPNRLEQNYEDDWFEYRLNQQVSDSFSQVHTCRNEISHLLSKNRGYNKMVFICCSSGLHEITIHLVFFSRITRLFVHNLKKRITPWCHFYFF